MAVVRVFVLHEDYDLATNQDVDTFFPFWKAINYLDDLTENFVFKQMTSESSKDHEFFL